MLPESPSSDPRPEIPAAGAAVQPLDRRKPATPILAARVLQFQATVLSHDTFDEAAAAFATEIAAILNFERAAIGFAENKRARVVATSHTAEFQAGSELFGLFSAAMDDALDQTSTVAFPASPEARPLINLAHAQLSRRYGGAVCTVPLVARGNTFGALTLARGDATPPSADDMALCEHLAVIVGPILELKRAAEASWHKRLDDTLRSGLRALFGPGRPRLKAGVAAGVAVLLGLTLVPVQYRVGAQARIDGAVQRALVAPADGFLRQVYARPGDAVKADQVLAELAQEDLQLEQRKWQSELTQHENAASSALARADRAQYVINQAKADEARAQLDLAERQLSRTRILAPFEGVVIKGDLTQSLGAPVRRGDVLLTIAPAKQYRLVVEADERDVSALQSGQHGYVALGAFSDRTIGFHIKTVTPVATTREGRNFFEVIAELEGAGSMPGLRPGLQGVAKVDAGSAPLAWIWTHRLIGWLRLTLWSWGL